MARDERLPLEIRQHAVMIARHFPTIEQISHLAATTASSPFPFGIELEEPEANPEWREACRHGPLTLATRLRWPNDSANNDRLLWQVWPRALLEFGAALKSRH